MGKVSGKSAGALVERYRGLVLHLARKVRLQVPQGDLVEFDDLVNAGIIGLLEAAARYDSERGASFETYAAIRIRGSMLDTMRRIDWTPRQTYRDMREIDRAALQIESLAGRPATDKEVADYLEIDLAKYQAIRQDFECSRVMSTDGLTERIEGLDATDPFIDTVMGDEIGPQDEVDLAERCKALREALDRLPRKENMIVMMYFRNELKMREIGEILDVCESRVSQSITNALKRLRLKLGAPAIQNTRLRQRARRATRTTSKSAPGAGGAARI